MSEYINIPNVSVVIILIVFGMFVWQAYKVRLLYKLLEKATNSDDTLNALKETKIASIAESYAETICIDITERKQTGFCPTGCAACWARFRIINSWNRARP